MKPYLHAPIHLNGVFRCRDIFTLSDRILVLCYVNSEPKLIEEELCSVDYSKKLEVQKCVWHMECMVGGPGIINQLT